MLSLINCYQILTTGLSEFSPTEFTEFDEFYAERSQSVVVSYSEEFLFIRIIRFSSFKLNFFFFLS